MEYYAAYDDLNRLRCVGRSSISSCTGTQPWADDFLESFDYDKSGNRTYRTYGAYADDDDEYTYETGTDIIDKVKVAGTDKEFSNNAEGQITEVNTPVNIVYNWANKNTLSSSNEDYLGNKVNRFSHFNDRLYSQATCNLRKSYFWYDPGYGGASHRLRVGEYFDSCANARPYHLRTYVYVEGRPIAVILSERPTNDDQEEVGTFWIHTDQLGTPVLVTQSDGTERWRWENDPFGRAEPIEFTVVENDISDEDSSSGSPPKYNTCCCSPSCGAGCNLCTTGCSAGDCTGGADQDVVWSKTFDATSADADANNIRLHFSEFDVADGSSRTGKDYVELKLNDDTVIAQLTGDLGAHWTPWAGEDEPIMKLDLISDYAQDDTRGVVVDKYEYTTDDNERFIVNLRMAGQIHDEDAHASYNFHRWYRSDDGRYLSPGPDRLGGRRGRAILLYGRQPSDEHRLNRAHRGRSARWLHTSYPRDARVYLLRNEEDDRPRVTSLRAQLEMAQPPPGS